MTDFEKLLNEIGIEGVLTQWVASGKITQEKADKALANHKVRSQKPIKKKPLGLERKIFTNNKMIPIECPLSIQNQIYIFEKMRNLNGETRFFWMGRRLDLDKWTLMSVIGDLGLYSGRFVCIDEAGEKYASFPCDKFVINENEVGMFGDGEKFEFFSTSKEFANKFFEEYSIILLASL